MIHDEGKTQTPVPVGNDLEPYRRMVEMQRQIIELVKKREQSQHEYDQLREQVAREIDVFCSPRQGLYPRLRYRIARLWRRLRRSGARAWRAVRTTDVFSSSSQSPEI